MIVCGETGSGKSTQLPKICLELGRGLDGMIAHTLAAKMIGRVRSGRSTPEEAAVHLARFCVCSIFNPARAARILDRASR